MELKRYGVKLKRLTIDKIELVRNWRNDPKISQYMFFREHITQEMQLKWFNKINNEFNYYFIIEYEDKEIGLSNIKDIDMERRCGEAGLFIYEDEYLNSDISFRVSFCQLDFAFDELKLDYLYGQIVSDNKRAVQFNKALGADINVSDDENTLLLTIYKENYYKQRDKYARILV